MSNGVLISSNDAQRLQNMLRWFEHGGRHPKYRRRGGVSGGGTKQVRRVISTEAATNNNHITCNLYNSNGVEQTSGDESGIEVYCSICGGSALDEAIPRLQDNKDLFVVKLPYDNAGTPEDRWYCISTIFQTIDKTKGLEISGDKLAVNIVTAKGLQFDSGAIAVNIDEDELSFVGGEITTDLFECV